MNPTNSLQCKRVYEKQSIKGRVRERAREGETDTKSFTDRPCATWCVQVPMTKKRENQKEKIKEWRKRGRKGSERDRKIRQIQGQQVMTGQR